MKTAAVVAAFLCVPLLASCGSSTSPANAPTLAPNRGLVLDAGATRVTASGTTQVVITGGTFTVCSPSDLSQCETVQVVAPIAPTPMVTAAPTDTPSPAATDTPSATPTYTPTAVPTDTPSPLPTATPTLAPTPSPTATPTLTPTVPPTPPPTPAPTATPTVAPTPAPTLGAITYAPSNTLVFAGLSAKSQAVALSQANNTTGFSTGSASVHGIAYYTHGRLPTRVLNVAPKGYGATVIPIVGQGGIAGSVIVIVQGTPTPAPTLPPTPQPTNPPTPAPTATPTMKPTPSPQPTASPIPVTVSGGNGSVNVGGDAKFTIHQGSYTSGFTAASNNTAVATVSVSGNILDVHGVAVGSASVTIFGNGGAAAILRIRQ